MVRGDRSWVECCKWPTPDCITHLGIRAAGGPKEWINLCESIKANDPELSIWALSMLWRTPGLDHNFQFLPSLLSSQYCPEAARSYTERGAEKQEMEKKRIVPDSEPQISKPESDARWQKV